MPAVPPSPDVVHDLEVLLHAWHPLIWLETDDDARAHAVLTVLADRYGIPHYQYKAHAGLCLRGLEDAVTETRTRAECLAHIARTAEPAIYELGEMRDFSGEAHLDGKLKEIHAKLHNHEGAVIFVGTKAELRPAVAHRITRLPLAPPTREEYYTWVKALLDDMRTRIQVDVDLSSQQGELLLRHLHGLTMYEVKKILTRHFVEARRLDASSVEAVRDAKRRAVEASGVLEYFPSEHTMSDIAGLVDLKKWLRKRKLAFDSPERAAAFGLTPPRGILLLGVQGCGKSLSAKAVASEWHLPLLRLDPSNIYDKYLGESEAKLKRAMSTAEAMAPVVLWIDEIEKAFHSSDSEQDGGTSSRVFGSFLAWMQEKRDGVFVIATSNDIARLPPELIRKGRFDEIFFVDLPDLTTRRAIFGVHLERRKRAPNAVDLQELATASEGFSGAEIEQAVISALYTAFSEDRELDTALILEEMQQTQPLSVTMRERIESLRRWAQGRAVPAG